MGSRGRHRRARGRHRRARAGRAVVAVTVAVALVVAGCSSDDGSDDTAAPGGGDGTTTTTTPSDAGPEPAADRSLEIVVEPTADLVGYNVYRPADLDATGAPLPVVVWANGGCVRFDGAWAPLLEAWAAAGFVVVAITFIPGQEPRLSETTADDQAIAIDWAAEQNERSGSPLEGKLDLDRVVAAGNSCGGITSVALTRQDPRIAALFVLSGSSVIPGADAEAAAPVMAEVEVPSAWVVGGPEEDIAYAMANQDYDLLPPGVPGLVVNRATGDHPTVSTDPSILADVAAIGVNWMDLALFGTPAALEALESDPCGACAAGPWTVRAKELESLVAP